ncbi:MAG: hypothetical protein KAW12_00935 [Candidatus Aminicenantes bacterium]|nr:hypothetical protein [Candidatus Aminicenantes bacterium]
MEFSTIISLFALLISFFIFVKNYLKPFRLFARTGKIIYWADRKDHFNVDILIILCNLGIKKGLIENISLKIKNGNTYVTIKEPDVFYKVNENRVQKVDSYWSMFLLSGNEEFSKMIGFKSSVKIDSIEEGKKEVELNIVYRKKLTSSRTLNHPMTFSIKNFRRKTARARANLRVPKKRAAYPKGFFYYNPIIM